jgi:phosphoribosylaminoimidazole-succinocarboxamide synthase
VRIDGASLATESPKHGLADRGFDHARAFQNRIVEWVHDGTEPVAVLRAPTGAGKTATFHELIEARSVPLLVYPTNALLRQQRKRFSDEGIDVAVLNSETLSGHGRDRVEELIAYFDDYDAYHDAGGDNYLVPLEVVFRNRVGVGSSLRRRTAPADHGLPFDEWPDEAVSLDEPVVEFSTKYEEQDRYLDREEAARIAGAAALDDLERVARRVNAIVTERADEVGLSHQGGAIECL